MRPTKRRSGRLVLVLGGAASGKSAEALTLAGQTGRQVFVATAEALDPEMAARICRHQQARSTDWETAEVPVDVAEWLRAKGPGYDSIVVDCLTLWLSNLRDRGLANSAIAAQVSLLVAAARRSRARVVFVSNELGAGLVPSEAGSRTFRDLMGQTNQQIAAAADDVYLVTAGIRQKIK